MTFKALALQWCVGFNAFGSDRRRWLPSRDAFNRARHAERSMTKGRVAWVTGGGRGIGRAAALALAKAGAHVGLTARSRAELEAVAKECQALGVKAVVAPADVSEEAAVDSAYSEITKKLGAPVILVNAAGIARSAPFLKTSVKELEQHWQVNLVGTFLTTRRALPSMAEAGWGRIVNVASVAGKVGHKYVAAYTASKHAVVGLTRAVAAEFASKGITVNAVCPGYVDTPMTDANIQNISERTGMTIEEARSRLMSMSPQNRLITPQEVAASILHFVQESSQGLNGQALTIDGGAIQW
jgi:NAD(P)-dependent dehydrogenase (short-subunit alcohol dehydrogenase family)